MKIVARQELSHHNLHSLSLVCFPTIVSENAQANDGPNQHQSKDGTQIHFSRQRCSNLYLVKIQTSKILPINSLLLNNTGNWCIITTFPLRIINRPWELRIPQLLSQCFLSGCYRNISNHFRFTCNRNFSSDGFCK